MFSRKRHRLPLLAVGALTAAAAALLTARAELPEFLQHAISGSAVESALYRIMQLPGKGVLYPRPPKEQQTELGKQIAGGPPTAELYRLRAMADEQALDFTAAETDWKAYAEHASDKLQAQLQLADFYARRVQPRAEVQSLLAVGNMPQTGGAVLSSDSQPSWQAFARLVRVAERDDLPPKVTRSAYEAWMARYPHEPAVPVMYFLWLVSKQDDPSARTLIVRYQAAFPQDAVFPVKASALLAVRGGRPADAVTIYDKAFQPLWPQDLLDSYFALLAQMHTQRAFLADARTQLAHSPDDMGALARIFWYERQNNQPQAAQEVIDDYRVSKDARNAPWTAAELYTLAMLMQRSANYPEAARYAFALYNLPGNPAVAGSTAQQSGLAVMCSILLAAPDQPIALGSQNLSMYQDIARLDQGPGYWNGILSLWFNSTSPGSEFSQEEIKAQPYFRRSKAASLLVMLDTKFPAEPERASLHARLIAALASYGEVADVIRYGGDFLQQFQASPHRLSVALAMADAYQRRNDTASEFALYDRMLAEFSDQTRGMPLTAAEAHTGQPGPPMQDTAEVADSSNEDETTSDTDAAAGETKPSSNAYEVSPPTPVLNIPGAAAYKQILDRYLGRLVSTGHPEQALAVLRQQIDRNPDDPAIYERLATFLQQNNLGAQQEEVYKAAMARFSDTSWASKLARFYLRSRRASDFAALTRRVTDTFSGTDLDTYFAQSGGAGPQMFLQVNLYAARRFPHDLVFVRNLLTAYAANGTRDPAARDALLREHWWEADDLRSQFFESLQRSNELPKELSELRALPGLASNPAANREIAEAEIWSSHFEQSATPLQTVAELYPADLDIGSRAVSVFRSLAYYDPANTAIAIRLQQNLIAEDPSDLTRLATAGDIYADAGAEDTSGHENLTAATPFWKRMAQIHPGDPDGYLQSATVFWDYFRFDDALGQLHATRTHLEKPTLFAYEAGAIEEGRRDFAAAIAEYTAGALQDDSEARARLLTLAARKPLAPLIDSALDRVGSSEAAMILREDVLLAEHREDEIAQLLTTELAAAHTVDDAARIATRAQAHKLTPVYERSLEKQIDLTTDPIDKIQLQYTLARSLEAHQDNTGAARIIETVYLANPKLLGVIRTTVDFYWRIGDRDRAVNILQQAASVARPGLARAFTLEAADKASTAGEYALARQLLAPLLQEAPFDPQLVAAVANTWSRAGDQAELRDFYLEKLTALKSASLTPAVQRSTQALLRRSLIPALTQLHDYNGATDQYIALLSLYPEDDALINEAALYAMRWNTQPRLSTFLTATVSASPRDSRFAAMQAQMATLFGDLNTASDAWRRAVAIRADRVDWFSAKANLDVRLGQLDEAVADDERLYVLSYRDPQWLVDAARIRARQGHVEDAVHELERAYTEGHKPTSTDEFSIASALASWNLLEPSRRFAERGVEIAGDDLLVKSAEGAVTYAAVMTRLRATDIALVTLTKARDAAHSSPSSPTIVAAEVQAKGLASVTDAEWRRKAAADRAAAADRGFQAALRSMASTAGEYFTPEEKAHFAPQLSVASPPDDLAELAGLAGMPQLQADTLRAQMLKHDPRSRSAEPRYVALQTSRLQFTELGRTLEEYAATLPAAERGSVLQQAAEAWRNAGDASAELRVLLMIPSARTEELLRDRLLQLLLERNQPQLFRLAAQNDSIGDAAANFTLAHANESVALQAIAARGSALPPVWNSVYRGLTGLYFGDTSTSIDHAFHSALQDDSIADRLGKPVEKNVALAGEQWFFFAGRYGVFRLQGGPGNPEDFAAAQLEHSAGLPNYLVLARTYAEANRIDPALEEYRHALELSPHDPAIEREIAVAQWKTGRHEAALVSWKLALEHAQHGGSASCVTTSQVAGQIAGDANTYGVFGPLRPALTAFFQACIAADGAAGSNELLRSAYNATATPRDGAAWIIELAAAATDHDTQRQILDDLRTVPWLAPAARLTLLAREVELARQVVTQTNPYSLILLSGLEIDLASAYMDAHNDSAAESTLAQVPADQRNSEKGIIVQLLLAAHHGTLAPLLEEYAQKPDDQKPAAAALTGALQRLQINGDYENALALREYLFHGALERNTATDTDYLALAELHLKTGDTSGAVALLRRMILMTGSSTGEESAARLLETTAHWQEAIPFLSSLTAAEPWNAEYTVRLAEARLHAGSDIVAAHRALQSVALSSNAPYLLRVRAALGMHAAADVQLGSEELNLLSAARPPSPSAAAQMPYAAVAPLAAAGLFLQTHLSPAQTEPLLRLAIAASPGGPYDGQARIALLRQEAALGKNALALAAVEPLRPVLEASAAAGDTDSSFNGTQSIPTPIIPSATAQAAWIGDDDRAVVLAEIATLARQQGDRARAMADLQLAISIAGHQIDAARVNAWRRTLAADQAALQRVADNEARRPVVSANLIQSNEVRPRTAIASEAP